MVSSRLSTLLAEAERGRKVGIWRAPDIAVNFARKAAALAEAFAEPIAFDDCSRTVTLTLSTHLAMARPNVTGEITRASYYGATTSVWTGCPRSDRAASVLQKAR